MKRRFTQFVIFTVAILSAELLVQFLTTKIPNYGRPGQPYYSSLARMGLIIAVFYPCYLVSREIMRRIAKAYVRNSKKLTPGWWRGMIISYALAIVVLLWGYANVWYGRDLFADAWYWFVNLV